MESDLWTRVEHLCQEALDRDESQLAAFLDVACGANQDLRREVESLLAHRQRAHNFLEGPAVQMVSETFTEGRGSSSSDASRFIGRIVSHYRILEKVASGGMGDIYRAVRADGTYDKRVAIKIIQGARSSDFFLTRFQNERQILANLDHPNIARLIDGGTTEEGLPFLVMEFVDGRRIDGFCVQQNLGVRERLELFRAVCSAVHFAHQNLIVHRDLKPSNVLVTPDGVPKLLDFGIAKILTPQKNESDTQETVTLLPMLTPGYASPEQVKNEPISTTSDVYSLGVILYELLSGGSPYGRSADSPGEFINAICNVEPEKPSVAVRRALAHAEATGKQGDARDVGRRLDEERVEKLRKILEGDLDNIVLNALRKEPTRRYSSVDQFSEDIRRYLFGLPVQAHKDSLGYRTKKFVWRHKLGVAAAAIVVLVLAGGLAATLWQARIATQERVRAERRFNDVRSLANSLIFDIHDSIKDLPGSTPARKLIVDRALQYLNSLAGESRGDVSLQRELATAYERVGLVQGHYLQSSLGDTQGSLESYQKALRIRKEIVAKSGDSSDRLALAASYRLVAHQQAATGDRRGARENIDAAILISKELNNARPNDPSLLDELAFDYAVAAESADPEDPTDAKRMADYFRDAVIIDEAILRIKPDDLEANYRYAIDLSHVGDIYEYGQPDSRAALPYYEKELEIMQRVRQHSPDIRYARGVARAYGQIAGIYDDLGDSKQALENHLRDLAIYQELIEVDPQNTLLKRGLAVEYGNTATYLGKTGDTGRSLAYMQKGLEGMRAIVASSPQNTGDREILAQFYMASGSNLMRAHKPQAALIDFGRGYAINKSLADAGQGSSIAAVAACLKEMGEAAAISGNANQAADYYHQALRIVDPLVSASSPDIEAVYAAADIYTDLGDLSLQASMRSGHSDRIREAQLTNARSWYAKSLEAWRHIEHPSHVDPSGIDVSALPEAVEDRLRRCDAALASILSSNN